MLIAIGWILGLSLIMVFVLCSIILKMERNKHAAICKEYFDSQCKWISIEIQHSENKELYVNLVRTYLQYRQLVKVNHYGPTWNTDSATETRMTLLMLELARKNGIAESEFYKPSIKD